MTITVTKSSPVLVGPATAPQAVSERITLTSFDMALAFFPVTSYHVFDHAIPDPAETVRRGLSRALVHYFPVAGRLVVSGDDDLRIACTGEGVSFVSATADCSLADVKLLDPPFGNDSAPLMRDLAAGVGEEGFRATDPLLLVQVTEFACGGFVLAATRNHAVADGTGFARLLRAAGASSRAALPARPSSPSPAATTMPLSRRCRPPSPPWSARCCSSSRRGTSPCATWWVPSAGTTATASRRRWPCPRAGEVANGSVVDVVRLIKRAKQQMLHQFRIKKKDDGAGEEEGHEDQLDDERM
ncbi:hypothetical protein PR202_ga20883 [Eleusine coracana subsp. coracana]|uniref:Uncharacterized protein n=1 Tax=Eleusine coracana subsp. coracana TaxID=191504 RepID=A0AAV5CYA0_ELECO|nr:hypothetical protein PR202_ga20883 [Eleusine coracana subsp. coracana]